MALRVGVFYSTSAPCLSWYSQVFCKWRYVLFFSIWVFFHKHSQFTGEHGKGEAISLTSLYQFQPLDRHTLNRQLQKRAHLCTSAHSLLPDPHQETLFSKRKSLTTKLRAFTVYSLLMCHSNLWIEASGFISPP